MQPSTRDALADPEFVRDLPPELAGGLTFHLPLVLQAYEVLQVGQPPASLVEAELEAAFARGMVDPPFYRWAVDAYAPAAGALIDDEEHPRRMAFRAIEELGAGLAGAAFHGLIRLGFGSVRRDHREIARGLAYLRSRRQVLVDAPAPEALDRAAPPSAADASVLEGATIFDQFNLIAGERMTATPPSVDVVDIVTRATDLFLSQPSSFVAVHCLTSAHAMVEFSELVDAGSTARTIDSIATRSWWRSLEVAHTVAETILSRSPAREIEGQSLDAQPSLQDLLIRSASSEDVHTVKVAAAVHRLVELDLLERPAARAILAAKLESAEC